MKSAVFKFLLVAMLPSSVTPAVVTTATNHDRAVAEILKSNQARIDKMSADSAGVFVIKILSDSGYLGASYRIDSAGRIEISPGFQSHLRKVITEGDTTAELLSHEPFTENAVTEAVLPVLTSFQSRGHYFATVVVKSLSMQGDSVDVTATIRKGPLVTISGLKCDGLRRTSYEVVVKLLGFVPSEPLTSSKIEALERRAQQIPFLTYLPPAQIEPQPGYTTAILTLHFREPSAFSLTGTGGYRPDDKNGVVWALDATLRDLFGTSRKIRVLSERRDKDNSILDLSYTQPSFVIGRGQFDARIGSRDLRSKFSEFAFSVGLSTYVNDQSLLGGKVGWSRVDPADSTFGYNKYTAGIRYDMDARYDSLSPVSGFRMRWSVDYQLRSTKESVDSITTRRISKNESRSSLSLEKALPIHTPAWAAITKVDLMALFTNEPDPPLSELFLLGGPGSIRGYRTDQFAAVRAAIGSLELHLRGKQGYLLVFADAGYMYSPLGEDKIDESTKWGYGTGFRLIDRDRLVEVALGWNPDLRLNRPQLILRLATGL